MNRITIANQKGGLGKTSISTTFARFLASFGKKVLFIDLDIQGNGTYTLNKYTEHFNLSAFKLFTEELKIETSVELLPYEINEVTGGTIIVAQATADLARLNFSKQLQLVTTFEKNVSLLESQLGIDFIVIDTPPTLTDSLGLALQISYDVVIPLEPEIFSFLGLNKLLTSIKNSRKSNPRVRTLGLFFSRVVSRKRVKATLEQYRADLAKNCFNQIIAYRDSISEAMSTQADIRSIAKNKRAALKAYQELYALFKEVCQRGEFSIQLH